ncbi:Microtubule-binding protein TANGLED [Sesamum angolense]|uniref:Microtubule-binding protein TANGLED n=1 Tax=Sesamum angolense TaxID=2727404 RepID=A0AAE2C2F6_9LAMI|nr:Microtubule-binding protein TANGLED [Sesamum angolense]
MVARSPPKQQRKTAVVVAPPPLSPTLLRETVKKVDKCMARLQELQHTVTGGRKVVSGVSLSPRSSRGYLRTSLRCKQESLRIKNANSRRSPTGKLPICAEEWQRMSLPAMLLGETMGEILQASQFARNIVDAVSSKARKLATDDPKTPLSENRKHRSPSLENSGLQARRRREKQVVLQTIRSESNMPSLQRAKSRINFKGSSPVQNGNRECDKENCRYIANRVSPRNKPWARKTVLFPNPLFHSSPTSKHQKFCKTKSPVIARNRQQTPHKFLIKSPPAAASKFQVKIKSPPLSISPTRAAKKLPKAASSAAAKLRRSFSPSRLANRLVSPLKSRRSVQKNEGAKIMSGLKQRPMSFSIRFSPRRV